MIFTLLFRAGFCVFRICPGEHQSPSSCGAAPPLLAEMLAPRAFAAGAGDTGESCASSRLSLRSLRAASLHGLPAPCGTLNHSDPSACLLLHRIDLELTPCKKLPGRHMAWRPPLFLLQPTWIWKNQAFIPDRYFLNLAFKFLFRCWRPCKYGKAHLTELVLISNPNRTWC